MTTSVNNEYLVDLTVYIGGSAQTLHFTSGAGRNYSGTQYEGRIKNPGSIKYMMFADGTTMGASQIGYGVIEFANTDGGLDWLINAGFSGRACVIRELIAGAAIGMTLSCSMEQPVFDSSTMSVRVKDPAIMLNIPVQPNKYGGTNVLPAGVDGTADIQGRPKPLLYGQCSNVTPVCVNTSRLIFDLHDGVLQSVSNVYDKGVPLTFGTDRADNAAMQANPPAPGSYDTCLAEGLIRLGSSPFGVVTADAIQGATAADRTAAQIAKTVALKAIAAGDMVAGDFTALDTLNSSVIGIYITEETLIPAVLDEVLNSIGGWYGFDSSGKFNVGRLDAPSGTAAASLTNYEILELQRLATQDEGRGLPTWKVNLGYDKNYTVQDSSNLGGILQYSNDAQVWQIQDLDAAFKSACFGGGIGIGTFANPILGASVRYTTDDGYTWQSATLPYTDTHNSIVFGNNIFLLAPGSAYKDRYIKSSNLGWLQMTNPLGNVQASNIAFGAGVFTWLNANGSAAGYYSADGENWTSYTPPQTQYGPVKIVFSEHLALFIAVGINNSGNGQIMTSPDGYTWTARTVPTIAGGFNDIASGSGVLVAVTDSTATLAYSSDGITWVTATAAAAMGTSSHIFWAGSEGFLTVDNSQTVQQSDDGLSWRIKVGMVNGDRVVVVVHQSNNVYAFSATLGKMYRIYHDLPRTSAGWKGKEYRTVTDSSTAVKTTHINAVELNINTLLVSATDAQTEATRQLNLRKVRRDYIAVKIKRSALSALPDLGSIINITYPRFGYDTGKLFALIGFEMFLETDDLTLYLWG